MLCLTGALTSKAYAFTSRPWELRFVESIDILDGLGSGIRVDFKESEVVRVLPKKNLNINENWISDKVRFFYDGLKTQRLTTPFLKKKGLLQSVKWQNVSFKLASLFKTYSFEYGPSKIGFIAGSSVDTESLYSLKDFALNYGFSVLGLENQIKINVDNPTNYKFQSSIKGFENVDSCIFLGTNPRFEASTFNLRLRKIYKRGSLTFSSYGGNFVSTFPVNFLGLTLKGLIEISEGKHLLSKTLIKAKNPSIVYGSSILERFDKLGFQNALNIISSSIFVHTTKLIDINLLHKNANDVGGLEIGFKSIDKSSLKNLKLVYGLELNINNFFKKLQNQTNSLVIFQKSTGNRYTNMADLVLPSTTFIETQGSFYNTEGRPQQTEYGMLGPELSKDNWKIIRLIFDKLGKLSFYSKKLSLNRSTSRMLPSIYGGSESSNFLNLKNYYSETLCCSYFKLYVEDFFMTHPLCFNSKIFIKASKSLRKNAINYEFLKSFR